MEDQDEDDGTYKREVDVISKLQDRCQVLESYDLMMVVTDAKQGQYGKHMFYKMQVLHDILQDLYILWTRWVRVASQDNTNKRITTRQVVYFFFGLFFGFFFILYLVSTCLCGTPFVWLFWLFWLFGCLAVWLFGCLAVWLLIFFD